MAITPATLSQTDDGTPYALVYDDVYHSRAGAIAQARHVFLGGNQIPARWANRDSFVIVETGFGLGNNFLATWAAWRAESSAPCACRWGTSRSRVWHCFSTRPWQAASISSGASVLADGLLKP